MADGEEPQEPRALSPGPAGNGAIGEKRGREDEGERGDSKDPESSDAAIGPDVEGSSSAAESSAASSAGGDDGDEPEAKKSRTS